MRLVAPFGVESPQTAEAPSLTTCFARDETPQRQPGVTKNFHSRLTLDSLSPVLFIRVRRTFLDEFPHMAEGIEFIDIALMERRSLETALAQLVAKYNRLPSSELARMIRGINAEIIHRRRVPAALNQPMND